MPVTYIILYINYTSVLKNVLNQYLVTTYNCKESEKEYIYIYIYIYIKLKSLCCIPETNTTL